MPYFSFSELLPLRFTTFKAPPGPPPCIGPPLFAKGSWHTYAWGVWIVSRHSLKQSTYMRICKYPQTWECTHTYGTQGMWTTSYVSCNSKDLALPFGPLCFCACACPTCLYPKFVLRQGLALEKWTTCNICTYTRAARAAHALGVFLLSKFPSYESSPL